MQGHIDPRRGDEIYYRSNNTPIRLDRSILSVVDDGCMFVRVGICPLTISDPRGMKHGGETQNPAEVTAESLRAAQQQQRTSRRDVCSQRLQQQTEGGRRPNEGVSFEQRVLLRCTYIR